MDGDDSYPVSEPSLRGLGAADGDLTQRSLSAILFTDVVASTELVVRLGDVTFIRLLADHDVLAQHEVARFGGRIVQSTGDGVVAVFRLASSAMRCAANFRAAARAIGLNVRCGVHVGEIQHRGEAIGGVNVNVAARVCARAAPGEVLVSDVARRLVFGSGLAFEARPRARLKGLPGAWALSALIA